MCGGSIFQRIHQTIFTPKKNPFPPEKSPHKRKRVIAAPERLMTGRMKAGCATYLVTIKIISQFHDFPPPGGQAYKMYPQRVIYQRIKMYPHLKKLYQRIKLLRLLPLNTRRANIPVDTWSKLADLPSSSTPTDR